MEDDEPGEAELRPLLREALAALREMQRDESVRPKLQEFAEGKISAAVGGNCANEVGRQKDTYVEYSGNRSRATVGLD